MSQERLSELATYKKKKKLSELVILSIEKEDIRRTWIQNFIYSICILKSKKNSFQMKYIII